jgi:hypothetical protein
MRDAQLKQAANDLRIAELGVIGNDLVAQERRPRRTCRRSKKPRRALGQLGTTFEWRRAANGRRRRMLEIQRDRAANAWKHARENADKMRQSPRPRRLVVLKTSGRNGSMAEVQEGEEVRPGLPILDVVDPSAMRVRVGANQGRHRRPCHAGQIARITLDSYPVAIVSRTPRAPLADSPSPARCPPGSVHFVAFFSIDGADPHLLPVLCRPPSKITRLGAIRRRCRSSHAVNERPSRASSLTLVLRRGRSAAVLAPPGAARCGRTAGAV